MKFNTAIYQEYRKFAIDSLNDTLLSTKEAIINNSLYRYGDLEDKIKVIEELKDDFAGSHFNFLKVKGVEYSKGQFQINETEFKDLIIENQVNLENYKFGLFQNQNDKEKPLAYKSFIQVTSILTYCLQLQILNEAKQQLEKPPQKDLLPESATFEKKYLNIFKPWGFELFKFLNEGFSGVTSEEPRYSILFHFFEQNKILKNDRVQKAYRQMVKDETDIKITFNRLSTTVEPGKKIYDSNKPELTYILNDFNKKYRNPFN